MSINPLHTAFVFPGQGSQFVGMGKELAETYPLGLQLFQRANDLLGFDLSSLCWEGPPDQLNDTLNTQPALLAHSLATLHCLNEVMPGIQPAFMAGHSLGEISALVGAGSIAFDDGIKLVRARGEAMKEAGDQTPGGMAAVLGLTIESVEEVCESFNTTLGDTLQIANDNCPGQVVISGTDAAVQAAAERLKEAGARRVIRLQVSIPAHSELMRPAQASFNQALESTTINEPRAPVIGNVQAKPLASPEDIRADLQAQLTSRVRWTESIQTMLKKGVSIFIELGPGDVLSNLIRRIDPRVTALSIDSPSGLDQLSQLDQNGFAA